MKMYYLQCLLAVATSVFVVPSAGQDFPYIQGHFTQHIDHFNLISNGDKTFNQRFLYQDAHWNPGVGPIFFYAGNEGPIEGFWKASGFVHELAPQFQALVVFTEHRYYGASLPFGNDSFSTPNLGYLSVDQAMADYAFFLTTFKEVMNCPKCQVIAFGGSYGGMLAAYMRFKYPNIIHGSLAASAPIYMQSLTGPRDFFFSKVTQDFYDVSPSCKSAVQKAFIEMDQLAQKGQPGYDQLQSQFRLCKKLTTDADYKHLLGWVRNAFTIMAMLDYPYPTDFLAPMPAYPVKAACKYLMTESPMDGLRDAAGILYNNSLKCFDIYAEFVSCADPTGCGTGYGAIAWDYQACTDILLPAGSNNVTDMFPVLPWTQQMRHDYCLSKYGIVPRPKFPAIDFWGMNISSSSNIIFSNGDLDPWSGGGVLKSVSDSLIAISVVGGAHHLDLRAENKLDPPGVIKAREQERSIIRDMINNFPPSL